MQEWGDCPIDCGSTFLKVMATANRVKNCSNFKEPSREVPLSDYGDKTEITTPNVGDVKIIKDKAKVFYASEVAAMNDHEDTDLVDRSRTQSIAYRKQQEEAMVTERTAKSVEKREKGLLKTQERKKKKLIVDAQNKRTAEERSAKEKDYKTERGEKAKQAKYAAAKKAAERKYKTTPEGMAKDAELLEAKKAVAKEEEKREAERTKKYKLWVKEAHLNETKRINETNYNISVAMNASRNGSATYDQLVYLDKQGISAAGPVTQTSNNKTADMNDIPKPNIPAQSQDDRELYDATPKKKKNLPSEKSINDQLTQLEHEVDSPVIHSGDITELDPVPAMEAMGW
jgi:hypothetical protein